MNLYLAVLVSTGEGRQLTGGSISVGPGLFQLLLQFLALLPTGGLEFLEAGPRLPRLRLGFSWSVAALGEGDAAAGELRPGGSEVARGLRERRPESRLGFLIPLRPESLMTEINSNMPTLPKYDDSSSNLIEFLLLLLVLPSDLVQFQPMPSLQKSTFLGEGVPHGGLSLAERRLLLQLGGVDAGHLHLQVTKLLVVFGRQLRDHSPVLPFSHLRKDKKG
ncbi:hypothetical protein EYF80_058103 [Liparis tanakae]|uniref:Uncharacterized protein n=1 Tax=Liparis tanakae TaxID=230148 RepID=A0A4Z2ES40_9TELE|nr:hypothetical protein EYF80_058103 [Liparis tanakae]